ncbi:hypothetical protein OESDEN_15590, partial [Oesophagostomum dentatum]
LNEASTTLQVSAFSDDKTIRHSSDLDCNFADPKKCRWKNVEDKWGLDSLDFYLFEKVDFTEFPALRVGPGPTRVHQGELGFWKTKEVELEACALTLMDREIECHVLPSEMSPAPVSVSFTQAAKNFVIVLRVRSYNRDFDSVVIIDDISYRATLCSDALSVFDLGEHFLSTPMLSLLLNRNVNSAKVLCILNGLNLSSIARPPGTFLRLLAKGC